MREIFESSAYLFARKGYENVSMREIAKANNINAASIYNYFPSKEKLLAMMYDFFGEHSRAALVDTNTILNMIPNKPPHEVLAKCMSYFSEDLQPVLDNICTIAIAQSLRNEQAFGLIWTHVFVTTKDIMTTVLESMIDQGKIEPINIDVFLEVYSAFSFSALFRNNSPKPIGRGKWVMGLEMINSIIKECGDSSPPADE